MSTKTERIPAANIAASIGAGRVPSADHLRGVTGPPPDPRKQGVVRSQDAMMIRLDRITRDEGQPREEFEPESLGRLAESLKTRGQLQPIRVRWDEGRGLYVIVCGERRWRAAALAGLAELACIVHAGDVDVREVQLIENALREDLKPIEQARAFKDLIDRNGWEHQELAAALAITGATVSRCLALLNLPADVQGRVEQGTLTPSAAYEVSKLADPKDQSVVAEAIVEQGLTKAETIRVIKAVRANRPAPARKPAPAVIDLPACTITVRWKQADPPPLAEVFRQALEG